ncbi:MFS transporter [Pectobacterium parvum]|uniref:MFS transporter n=3 Tax=Pectobacterium parvum TaxID=2778550 RepID=A0AAP9IGC0_9GAMM|nr:MFS transporter [Pectobacterium parvum]QHQ24167.1 MFS transporter [Pectobacterium parvum]
MNNESWFVTHPVRQKVLLVTIFLLTTLEFLQAGMIAFAASPIMGETGTSPEEYSFITATYACVAIMMISKQRWIVERTGWRLYIWSSLIVFITGALFCAESSTYHAFMTGRVIMAIGGASFMTGARVLVNLLPPSPLRFSGIKYFATGLAVGTALSPWLASLSVSEDTWDAIFYILIAVAILTFITSSFCLPDSSPPDKMKSDTHPFLLMWLAGGTFSILWVFQRSNYNFFSDSIILITIFCTGFTALFYFFRSISKYNGKPLLMVRLLFSNKKYIAGVGVFALCYLVLGANNYIIPQILQAGLGFSWITIGKWHAIGLSSALIAWFVMSWLMPKRPSSKKFFVIGFLALAVYGWMMRGLTPTANLITDILPALLCNGIFIMLVMATTAMHTFREVQHDETVFSHAQQVKNMIAQFFMALGITFTTLMMQWRTTIHYAVLNTDIKKDNPLYQDVLFRITNLYQHHLSLSKSQSIAFSWIAQAVKQQATILAGMDYFTIITVTGIAGMLIMIKQNIMK